MLRVLDWSAPRLDRMRSVWPLAVTGAAGLATFGWMCDAVGDRDGVTAIDGPISVWFVAHRSLAEGQWGLLVAKVTSPMLVLLIVAAVLVILVRRGYRAATITLAGATVLAYGSGFVAKYFEHRARPSSPINLAPEAEGSFPSGHVLVIATVAFVALGLGWAHMNRTARIIAAVIATAITGIVALDRLVVGAHWLTDVVGSLGLAAVITAVALAAHAVLARLCR